MCILIWRGRFCVIDEALDSNQLVIGAQLLNNAFIRPCDVFNGSPLQCKYIWSVLMSLLWASPGKMAHLTLWHSCTICLVYTQLASQKTNAWKFLQIVILLSSCALWKEHLCCCFASSACFFFFLRLPACQLEASCNNQPYLSDYRKQRLVLNYSAQLCQFNAALIPCGGFGFQTFNVSYYVFKKKSLWDNYPPHHCKTTCVEEVHHLPEDKPLGTAWAV